MGIGTQNDMRETQMNLNTKTGGILNEMKALAAEAQTTTDSTRLQQIQIALGDLQRNLDVMKQLEEKLAKAMESVNKFIQPQ